MAVSEPVERGRLALEYMTGDSSGITKVTETHEMGCFTHDEYLKVFNKSDL
jgi:hypothetical protein